MDFFNASVVIMCNSSAIRVTVVTPSALTGRHCVGWCTDLLTSTVDATNTDVTTTPWDAAIVSTAHDHNILLVALPDWEAGTYPAHSIVWYGGQYYYTEVETSQSPGDIGDIDWGVILPTDSNWSYVIADPDSYNATVFQQCVENCLTANCPYQQFRFTKPSCFTLPRAVYFLYNTNGPTFVQAGQYTEGTVTANVENCEEYMLYEFGVPNWSDNPYNLDDFIYYNGAYYVCIAPNSGNPDSAPWGWQAVLLNDTDFQAFWSHITDPNYSGNAEVSLRQQTLLCVYERVPVSYHATVDCGKLTIVNDTPIGGINIHYYTFLVAESGPPSIILPSVNNTSTGVFAISSFQCGIRYGLFTFGIPAFVEDVKGMYFEGALVWYNGSVYVCTHDVSASTRPDESRSWSLVCDDHYDASVWPYFEAITDSCYSGTAGYQGTRIFCPCTERYTLDVTAVTNCELNTVAITPTVKLGGVTPSCYAAAVFVYQGSTYVTSGIYAGGLPVPMLAVNGSYKIIVCAVPCWADEMDPWSSGSIVFHAGQFWRADGSATGEPGTPSGVNWVVLGITADDYTGVWDTCESTAQVPVNRQEFPYTVFCPQQQYPIQIDTTYQYECGSSTLIGNFTVTMPQEEGRPCYCVVVMLYRNGEFIGLYYIPRSPNGISQVMSPPLDDGPYQIETYAIPCCDSEVSYTVGEIVCYRNNLYICTVNTVGCNMEGYAWHMITDGEMRDIVSTIKSPEYPGAASYDFNTFIVDCTYDTHLEYELLVDPVCSDLSIGVAFNANIINVQFAYATWLFDVTDIGKPLSDVTVNDLNNPALQQPMIDCSFVTGSFSYVNLENNHSYCVLTLAVPYYKLGHMYMPDDLAYYNGSFWKVNPALGYGTMNPPDDTGSPQEWIKIYPSAEYPGCSVNYWNLWYPYVGDGLAYDYAIGRVKFECPPSEDATELNLSHSSVNAADASFALIRTNPGLTGNILLTHDKNGDLWFNSINANEELAKDQYKHYPVDITRTHPANVYAFFDKGRTPSDIVFDIHADVNPAVMTNKYEDQFDFSFYYSGVKYMNSKYYDEKFTYFAPLYLRKVIPEYFVIFKIDDPLNMPIDRLKDYDYNQTDYLYEILKRATLIKSFDLTSRTKLGKYLRGIIEDPMFPKSPLDVNFAQDGMTTWNGLSYSTGTWNKKGEMLYDLYTDDDALKYFEEYVTLGYKRHGVLFPNIINIEFLFDDETSEIFDFNRYIGFYVNAVALEQFDVDVPRYNSSQYLYENSPEFFDLIDECSDEPRVVSNPDGVKFPYVHTAASLDYRDFGLFKEKLFVNYVKDKNHMLHSMATDSPYDIIHDASSPPQHVLDAMRLADTSFDLSGLFGTDEVFLQDRGFAAKADGLATSYIKISGDLNNYDVIRVYHDAGSNSDLDGRYDDIIVYSQVSSPSYLPDPGDFYEYTLVCSPPVPNSYYINGSTLHGDVSPILNALQACVDAFPNKTFESVLVKDSLFLKSYASSLANGEYGIKFMSPVANAYDKITIGGYTGSDLVGRIVWFTGGTNIPRRLVIDAKHRQKIVDNMDNLLVRTTSGWSRILSVANYVDLIEEDKLKTEKEIQQAYDSYFGKIALALERNEEPDVSDGGFLIKTKAHAEFGMLSFFNVKDFDGDFYSTKYNRYPYWEYYKHLVIPPDKDLLLPDVKYIVKTNGQPGKIIYNGVTIITSAIVPAFAIGEYWAEFTAVNGVFSYSIPADGGSPTVSYAYPYNYADVDPAYQQDASSPILYGSVFFDQNKDMNSFDGFFAIRDSRNRTASLAGRPGDLVEYNKRFTDDIIRCEYDYYRENFTKDFAFKSKMLPYVCKWGYLEGMDARDNEYRLNNHVFFGEHNFSPSHIRDVQDESRMTHEWYYIVADYPFIRDRGVTARNYCYFTEDINLTDMLSIEGEFERYFTYVPLFDVNGTWMEIGRIQPRYSVIRYNDTIDACETFFRGAKLIFKDVLRDADGNVVYDKISGKPAYGENRRFDGYKFSVLLRPVPENMDDPDQPPIRMRFIEHSDYKFILFLIEVAVGYDQNINYFIDAPISKTGTPSDPIPAYGVDWLYGNPPNARVDGDYRISFTGGVSDLTYSFLYGTRNKKFGWKADLFSTIRIPTVFTNPAFTIDRTYVESRLAYSNYDVNMRVELTEFGGDPTDSPYIIAAGYYGDIVFNGYPTSVDQNNVTTNAGGMFSYTVMGGGFAPSMNDLSSYRQVAGGRSYFEKFMKKLSFASIMKYVNEMGPYKDKLNGFVEYQTYSAASADPALRDFYAEVIPPSVVHKGKALVPDLESVVPDKFKQVREIGFEFKKGSLQNTYEMYRYGGGYEPIFRNVFVFLSRYGFQYNPQLLTIFLANNVFATEIENFGLIENFCHMKVSQKKILALQDDPKFYPAYELLNEITIGRDTFVALHSSWDYGFHKRYDAKDRFVDVAGSLRVAEDYTYFSKVLNLPFDPNLLDYAKPVPPLPYDSKVTYEPVLVKNIDLVNMDKYCVVYAPGKNKGEWVGRINLLNAMIHKFKTNGVSAKFDEFLTPSNIATVRDYIGYTNVDDYVTAYLSENVYPLYDVLDTYFYVKLDHENVARFGMEYHDDTILLNEDWSLIKDVKINKYSKHVLSFTYMKPLNSGAVLSPVIKIRLI